MKVMVLIKATKDSECGVMPGEQLISEMMAFNEAMVNAGILVDGDGLHPSSRAKRVRFSGDERAVIDGPFAETKQLIAGYWIWEVKSMEEAIEWVKRVPNPTGAESEVEIRPVLSAEDFGPELTPELREQEERLSERVREQRAN